LSGRGLCRRVGRALRPEGVQVFNLDDAIDGGSGALPGMATLPISMKRGRVEGFAASFEAAIWTLRLPGLWERTAQLALALNLCFRASPPEAGRPGVVTGVGVLEDDTLAAFGSNCVQQGAFVAF
jgi:hypothetical protein